MKSFTSLFFSLVGILSAFSLNIGCLIILLYASPQTTQELPTEPLLSRNSKSQAPETISIASSQTFFTPTYSQQPEEKEHSLQSTTKHTPSTDKQDQFFEKAYEVINSFEHTAQISKNLIDQKAKHITSDQTYCYETKVYSQILTSQKILYSQLLNNLKAIRPFPTKNPLVEFSIRKDGSLNELKIVQSSGSALYDENCLKIVKHAFPMPRIPDHLHIDSIIFSTPIGL